MRSLLYVVLAIAAVCAVVIAAASVLSLSPDGPPASAAPASSTVPAPVPGVQSGAVVIDGSAADWASVVPIWQEAGKSGAGADGIDVKRFMVAHDGSKLHVFLETEPTPQEHYERTKMTGWLGALYFDVDNDESTGSRGAISACGPMLRLSGYEFEVLLTCGFYLSDGNPGMRSTGGVSKAYVTYEVSAVGADGQFGRGAPLAEQESSHLEHDIGIGADGVEAAFPFELFGLKPGRTFRILWVEEASGGYSTAVLTLGSETSNE